MVLFQQVYLTLNLDFSFFCVLTVKSPKLSELLMFFFLYDLLDIFDPSSVRLILARVYADIIFNNAAQVFVLVLLLLD